MCIYQPKNVSTYRYVIIEVEKGVSQMTKEYDLVVLGGGTGGYVAAIRASQLGMNVALVEKNLLGGTCLHEGCIPSKSLLKSAEVYQTILKSADFGINIKEVELDFLQMQKKKEQTVEQLYRGVKGLMQKNKIDIYEGHGRILGPSIFSPLPGTISIEHDNNDENTMIVPKKVLIATGSKPRELEDLPFDEELILSSAGALNLKELPKRMCIIGAGAIGIEWASMLIDLNVEVTVIESAETLLPQVDQEVSKELKSLLEKKGVKFYIDSNFTTHIKEDATIDFTINQKDEVTVDKVIVSIGREALIEEIGLTNTSIKVENGHIQTNEYYQTNESHIYAIGDCIGGLQLAHVASAEGRVAAEHMNQLNPVTIDNNMVPSCIYSAPEIAQIGLTEQKAKQENINYQVSKFPFSSIGKAIIEGKAEGFVKVIIDDETKEILGVHMIGPHVTDMISEASLAKMLNAIPWEIHETIHPHPSLSEVFVEATLALEKKEIHN